MNAFVLSQILLGIAFVSDIVSFQLRDRKWMLFCLVTSTSLASAHYFLLANSSAGLLMLLAAMRFTVAYFSKHQLWMWVFVATSIVVLLATYRAPVNVLAFLASVLITVASFQSADRRLRLWMMSGSITWLIHNFLIGSPAAVLLEAFFLGSNLTGYWRFYLRAR